MVSKPQKSSKTKLNPGSAILEIDFALTLFFEQVRIALPCLQRKVPSDPNVSWRFRWWFQWVTSFGGLAWMPWIRWWTGCLRHLFRCPLRFLQRARCCQRCRRDSGLRRGCHQAVRTRTWTSLSPIGCPENKFWTPIRQRCDEICKKNSAISSWHKNGKETEQIFRVYNDFRVVWA